VRELLALTSRLHGTLLDRKRPLWEGHLIEGLEGDRFAVYTKLHHAVMDGVSGLRLMQRSLSTDPDERDVPVPWQRRDSTRPAKQKEAFSPLAVPKAALQLGGDVVGLVPTLLHLANDALRHQAAALPLQAPARCSTCPSPAAVASPPSRGRWSACARWAGPRTPRSTTSCSPCAPAPCGLPAGAGRAAEQPADRHDAGLAPRRRQ
jgi:hypothetical protein